jgi:streptogramin lyase
MMSPGVSRFIWFYVLLFCFSTGQARIDRRTGESIAVEPPAPRTVARAARCYAAWVDERDTVWASDFGGNTVRSLDAAGEKFERFGFPREAAGVRQILGRAGEVWLPESGTEHLLVIRTA